MFQVIILSLVSLLEQTLINVCKIPFLKEYKYLLKSLSINNLGGIDMIWKKKSDIVCNVWQNFALFILLDTLKLVMSVKQSSSVVSYS